MLAVENNNSKHIRLSAEREIRENKIDFDKDLKGNKLLGYSIEYLKNTK